MQANHSIPLNVIRVDKPCPASWDAMRGDDRVRFCDECSLHVYNLSAMSRMDAEALVSDRGGTLCVRYFPRADGTVLTSDCGGGLRRAAKRARLLAGACAAMVLSAILTPLGIGSAAKRGLLNSPTDAPAVMGEAPAIMGDFVPPNRELELLGKVAPIMGVVASQLPATQPTTAPTTQPAE